MIRTVGVGVVVPAVNEQAQIGACLTALVAARAHLRHSVRHAVNVRIVVVLDSCVDGTADVVREHSGVESVRCTAGCVGTARAIGTRHLLGGSATVRAELWLANTDADSLVPENWLSAMLAEAELGVQLVLGTVLPDTQLPAGKRRAWFARHLLRDGHPHVHGANLGIRSDALVALGGWSAMTTGEDVSLGQRAMASQIRITRTAAIPVTTSTRPVGRAPHGFAAYLTGLEPEAARG